MPTIAETLEQAFRCHQAGNLREAEQFYLQILAADPNHADAHHLLGVLSYQLGRYDMAVICIRRALAINGWAAMYWSNLGLAQEALGQGEEAVASYRQALHLQPEAAEIHSNLGKALDHLGRLEEAESHCRRAVSLRPKFPTAYNNLGSTLLSQRKFEEAIACYRQALRIDPNLANTHNNLGNALLGQNEVAQATQCYRQALQLNPQFAEASYNLGNILHRQGLIDEAIACYERALQINPQYAGAANNLGNVCKEQGRFGEALAHYELAVRSAPANAEMHLNRGLLLLLLGRWEEGWPEVEWRWQTEEFAKHALPQPRWDGSDPAGRTIAIYAEQGLGDTVQFLRYAALLKQRGAKVIVRCQPALVNLLGSFRDLDELQANDAPLPECSFQAPLLSLPGILKTTVDTIPKAAPYLAADPQRVEQWRRELAPLGGFKIGIAWKGSPVFLYDHLRSIPLVHFEHLAKVPGVQLISLQKGQGTEQLEGVQSLFSVRDVASKLHDFMDTAAAIQNLDLVITCDSAVAHVAGALAANVWVGLPVIPDWRWLLEGEDTPWYPTMRLFRQTREGGWDEVFARMAAELTARSGIRQSSAYT